MCICPICDYEGDFKPYGVVPRENALCPSCGSLERKRLLYFILTRELQFMKYDRRRVLHFAPSKGMYSFFNDLDIEYLPKDFDSEYYLSKGLNVDKFNMCDDFHTLDTDSLDLVLSTHVLEHPKCSYEDILEECNRILRPGGLHVISAAMRGEHTKEDHTLTEEERAEQYGGRDHWRIFGHKDFPLKLKEIFGNVYQSIMFKQFSSEELKKYSIKDTSFYISYKE